MICRDGPLDGQDMPEFGTNFFIVAPYDAPERLGVLHVYGHVAGEWQYQVEQTSSVRKAARELDGGRKA